MSENWEETETRYCMPHQPVEEGGGTFCIMDLQVIIVSELWGVGKPSMKECVYIKLTVIGPETMWSRHEQFENSVKRSWRNEPLIVEKLLDDLCLVVKC